MKHLFSILPCLLVAAWACHTESPSAKLSQFNFNPGNQLYKCDQGTDRYVMEFQSTTIEGGDFVDFSQILPEIEITFCSDLDTGYVGQIRYKKGDAIQVIDRGAISSTQVADFLAGEMIEQFQSSANIDDETTLKILGREYDEATNSNIVAIGMYRKAKGGLKLISKQGLAKLVDGSPFVLCTDPGMIHLAKKVELESATMTFDVCEGGFGTPGSYKGTIVRVSVVDQSEHAGVSKGQRFVARKKDFGTVFKQHVHHHNICDSLKFETDHADYIITAGPAGIGGPEEYHHSCNNPDGVFLPNPKPAAGAWNSVYQVTYKLAKPVIEQSGRLDMMHYVKMNSTFGSDLDVQ